MGIRHLFALVGLVALGAGCSRQSDHAAGVKASGSAREIGPFLVKPYLQWGNSPDTSGGRSMEVLWHDVDVDAVWDVEYRVRSDSTWQKAAPPILRRIAVPDRSPRLYRASLAGLEPGGEFPTVFARRESSCVSLGEPRPSQVTSLIASWFSEIAVRIRRSRERWPTRPISGIPIS